MIYIKWYITDIRQLLCIVKQVDEKTRGKVNLNDLLRDL